jgi:flagellar protein FlaG
MMKSMNSLKEASSANLQEAPKASQRTRQGTIPPEGKNANAGKQTQARPMDRENVEALAKELNQTLKQIDGNFSVSVDTDTDMVVVRITDSQTGEVVRQIPPQQVLDANVSVERIIGLLVNDQA